MFIRIHYTQNLGPKKLSSQQIFDKPNPSPRWRRKHQVFDKWQEKPWQVEICQIKDPNQSYWLFWLECSSEYITHKILGPKNLSKNCQVNKFLTSQTRHHDGDENIKFMTNDKKNLDKLKFVRLRTQTSHIDCFFDHLDDPRDFVCSGESKTKLIEQHFVVTLTWEKKEQILQLDLDATLTTW